MKSNNILGLFVLLVLIVIGLFYFVIKPSNMKAAPAQTVVAQATYICMNGKTIHAVYSKGEDPIPTDTTKPPTPNGSVALTLSDGRSLTIPQALSGSGVRFADSAETTVFWNKGNGVTFTENGQQTFMGCMAVADPSGTLTEVYGDGSKGFTLRYPSGYTVDEKYIYNGMGPNNQIHGIKFAIPASYATGTNLSSDSYMSVEELPQTPNCSAGLFLDMGRGSSVTTVTDNGTTYSFASSTGAGAGNRYEETVYAMPGTNPCRAVRYFVHYGAIENYPQGAVREFDKTALLSAFDAIRRTMKVLP